MDGSASTYGWWTIGCQILRVSSDRLRSTTPRTGGDRPEQLANATVSLLLMTGLGHPLGQQPSPLHAMRLRPDLSVCAGG